MIPKVTLEELAKFKALFESLTLKQRYTREERRLYAQSRRLK
jgi:hypothetical protein